MTASHTTGPAEDVNLRIARAVRFGGEAMALATLTRRHSFAAVDRIGRDLLTLLGEGGCGPGATVMQRDGLN